MKEGPQGHGMAQANDGAGIKPGARHPDDRPRPTMAQAVAEKWIARYACHDVCDLGYPAANANTARH